MRYRRSRTGNCQGMSSRKRAKSSARFLQVVRFQFRACDLTKLRVLDVCHGQRVAPRATVMQQKTQRPVQIEITEQTRVSDLSERPPSPDFRISDSEMPAAV